MVLQSVVLVVLSFSFALIVQRNNISWPKRQFHSYEDEPKHFFVRIVPFVCGAEVVPAPDNRSSTVGGGEAGIGHTFLCVKNGRLSQIVNAPVLQI